MSAVQREVTIGNCRLLLGDCLAIMHSLDEVDHVISDPPYEDELHNAMGRIRRTDGREMAKTLGFEGVNASRSDIAQHIVRLSRGWSILFCLAEGVRAWRDELQAQKAKWDTCLAWVKPDAAPRFNGQGAARGFECAVTAWCGPGYRRWNGGGRRGVFVHPVNTGRYGGHPTEKPVPLMSDIVTLYSDENQLILDPFMGSGTTGVACVKHGRRFVGIERDEKHFDLACERISKACAQPDLFVAPSKGQRQASFFEAVK